MWLSLVLAAPILAADPVQFNRDIRSIFSDKCYTCHGPDKANRKTEVRFDVEAAARPVIVAGDPDNSPIIRRITATNPAMRMPPVYSGRKLTPQEIDLIRRWIEQGAKWEKHWSFIPPQRAAIPDNARHPIDYFVHERLKRDALAPSPEADRATLIRRVTLDLTGLPPTPAEVDAFLRDTSADAYEKVVDRLLASPRYGERMAARWLDAARYADTNGYQSDAERFMWRWRDWVIDAFNRNLPFDEFTVDQIAGDMLPHATLEQKIATGFNRNHRGNGEGGIIPEEYAVEYVVDRVETTSTVWLGLTLGCARCHDHKYDPFTQKEFYRFFAYFNNVPEKGKARKYGNSPPVMPAPTPQQQALVAEAERKLAAAEKVFAEMQPQLREAQRAWEASLGSAAVPDWTPADGLVDHEKPGATNFGFYDRFTLAAWIEPAAPDGAIVTRMQDIPEGEGYGLYLKDGKLQVNLIKRWLDDGARVETERALQLNRRYHVIMTYDGSRDAEGIKIYVDGELQKLNVHLDDLNQDFAVKEPIRIGKGFRGPIGGVRVYARALSPEDAALLALPNSVREIAGMAHRSPAQARKLSQCFLDKYAPPAIQDTWRRVVELRHSRDRLLDSLPTVMVMQEREQPRDTFLLIRGAYDRPGEKVTPAVPSTLPPLPAGYDNNRLGLARWLVDPSNPLTARVTVNRFWQMYFGAGLVNTVEDFGSQGDWPSHPELLDWLATEFIRTGWNVKALQKLIVTSATYRQSSRVTPELLQKDPENRLLARGPRYRLSAEIVRDQALAIAGLLVDKIGGPSVKPYQPEGLWTELGAERYRQDHGEKLYRRSLYTYWKRTAPPPALMAFDAAGRETCIVRQSRTNTPLQALDLMNEVTYVEASRVLAQRMMTEGGASPRERIAYGFRRALARGPSPEREKILIEGFQNYLDRFQTDRAAALKLVSQGEYPRDEKLDTSELAAYTTVAAMILNMDETVTKQ
jgi:hypothetical protein